MNAASLLITPSLGATTVEASVEARVSRDKLIATLKETVTVTDRLDADAALPGLRDTEAFLDMVEDQRSAAKAPLLAIGRKIDALNKEITAELTAQQSRVSRLVGSFEAGERDKADRLKREADDKAARIAFDAAQAERKAIAAAPTPEAAGRASDAIVGQAQAEIAAVRSTAVAAPKAAGTALRGKPCFEVTDIKALHAARPDLVALEPNSPLIRATITADPKIVIPGIKHWIEHKLSV